MTLKGHVRNGNVVLDSKVSLPEGAEVDVVVHKPHNPKEKKRDRFWNGLSVAELAAEQGVVPKPFEELLGGWPEEDRNDNFDEVVRRWRDEDKEAGR